MTALTGYDEKGLQHDNWLKKLTDGEEHFLKRSTQICNENAPIDQGGRNLAIREEIEDSLNAKKSVTLDKVNRPELAQGKAMEKILEHEKQGSPMRPCFHCLLYHGI